MSSIWVAIWCESTCKCAHGKSRWQRRGKRASTSIKYTSFTFRNTKPSVTQQAAWSERMNSSKLDLTFEHVFSKCVPPFSHQSETCFPIDPQNPILNIDLFTEHHLLSDVLFKCNCSFLSTSTYVNRENSHIPHGLYRTTSA